MELCRAAPGSGATGVIPPAVEEARSAGPVEMPELNGQSAARRPRRHRAGAGYGIVASFSLWLVSRETYVAWWPGFGAKRTGDAVRRPVKMSDLRWSRPRRIRGDARFSTPQGARSRASKVDAWPGHRGDASDRRGERVVGGRLRHTPRLRDPGTRPAAGGPSEHAGKLALRERVAGLDAQPVSSNRLVVDGICLGHLIVILHVCSGTRMRGRLTHRSSRLTLCLAFALPALPFASRGGWERAHESAAGRAVPTGLCRRSLL